MEGVRDFPGIQGSGQKESLGTGERRPSSRMHVEVAVSSEECLQTQLEACLYSLMSSRSQSRPESFMNHKGLLFYHNCWNPKLSGIGGNLHLYPAEIVKNGH